MCGLLADTMRLAVRSRARKLFIAVLLFDIPIVTVYLSTVWTMHDGDKTPAECSDLSLQQLEYPLLCMFTTFKPSAEKIPVSLRCTLGLAVSSRTNSQQNCSSSVRLAVNNFSTQMPNVLDDVVKGISSIIAIIVGSEFDEGVGDTAERQAAMCSQCANEHQSGLID